VAPDGRVLEVSEFYNELITHIEGEFGRRRPRWVRGEIEKAYEKGHLYLDVVDATPGGDDPRPVLKVRCWSSVWSPLKRELASRGVTLETGSVVTFCGYTGVYKPRGEVSFVITEIDVEGLLGDVARKRQALIDQLEREGALTKNRELPVPPVPLVVGLVTSPGTEGYNDFTGQLLRSGYSFVVRVAPTLVQGEGAPEQIADAINRLGASDVEVICVIRGGGSRGDLAAFDDERVARAIVNCPKPVFTGIGHTGDTSVADLVASQAAITPTQLGEVLVARVGEWRDRHVVRPADRAIRLSGAVLEEADAYLGERRRTVAFAVRDRLRAEQLRLNHTRGTIARGSLHVLDGTTQWLTTSRRLLVAYEPTARLRQGWAIVSGPSGRVLRSVRDASVGSPISVRLADGVVGATVTEQTLDA
jgi:exodeoxyribonuclease VII large subunit